MTKNKYTGTFQDAFTVEYHAFDRTRETPYDKEAWKSYRTAENNLAQARLQERQ